jgi:hypothetical protein
MHGPMPTHLVHLTAEEGKSFHQFIRLLRAQSTLQAVAVRARINLRVTV